MKTNLQILPGIKQIGWVECKYLPRRVDLHGITQTPVSILTSIHKLNFFDNPDCRCKTEKVSGNFSDTASLKFHSNQLIRIDKQIGFVVTDINDVSYLIGGKEPPFPKISVEQSTGSCNGDAAGYYYEISHSAIKSMVKCII